jgi:hypothetical protein
MNGAVCAEITQLIIPAKVSRLRVQSTILNSDINKDILSLTDRICAIWLRFNSLNHPGNAEKPCDPKCDTIGNVPPSSGLEQDLNNIIDENQKFIDAWNNNLYGNLSQYLSYIESHI